MGSARKGVSILTRLILVLPGIGRNSGALAVHLAADEPLLQTSINPLPLTPKPTLTLPIGREFLQVTCVLVGKRIEQRRRQEYLQRVQQVSCPTIWI